MDNNSSKRPAENSPSDEVESEMDFGEVGDPKEIFRRLVTLQDQGETVEMSRIRVSIQFNISQEDLIALEREGIAKKWPPLS